MAFIGKEIILHYFSRNSLAFSSKHQVLDRSQVDKDGYLRPFSLTCPSPIYYFSIRTINEQLKTSLNEYSHRIFVAEKSKRINSLKTFQNIYIKIYTKIVHDNAYLSIIAHSSKHVNCV